MSNVPERPREYGEEVCRRVTDALWPKFAQWVGSDAGDDMKEALGEALTFLSDGYDLAKELEDEGLVNPDASLVDVLDEASMLRGEHHQEAVKQWVKAHNLQPRFKEGDKVQCVVGTAFPEGGEVTHVYADTMRYTVYVEALGHVREGTGSHGLVLADENLRPA